MRQTDAFRVTRRTCYTELVPVKHQEQTIRQRSFWPHALLPGRIIFHNDFDGICSAAVLVRYFAKPIELEPIEYSAKPTWLKRRLETVAVVDFLFHPQALWWFDHHLTSFADSSLRSMYQPDPRHRWDPSYPSCPMLILDVLSESLDVTELRKHFAEWIKWSAIIDSAQYESPKQAVLGEEPCILINHALAETSDAPLRTTLVENIAGGATPLEVSESPAIRELWKRFRTRQAAALQSVQERLRIVGAVGLCDLTDLAVPFVRYGVYYFMPNLRYSVMAYDSGRGRKPYKIAFNANPWLVRNDDASANLGLVAEQYGGGGRRTVGSIAFHRAEDCRRVAERLANDLAHGEAERPHG